MVPRDWHCVQGPVVRKWPSIMASLDRGLSGPHMARLLGAWRSGGPAYPAAAPGGPRRVVAGPPARRTPAAPASAPPAGVMRLLALEGGLPLRTRLRGERELAAALGGSRTTAAAAYA